MKKLLGLILAAAMLAVCLVPAALADSAFYTGEAEGKNGTVAVEISVTDGKITDVQVTEQSETAGIADAALETIPAQIVKYQSLAIDAVASSTVTSNAILAAVEDAAVKAGLDVEALKANKVTADAEALPEEETADVVVIGAGGAGLSAAAAAAQNGASVIVLEANSIVGGSTVRSGGHLLVFSEEMDAAQPRNDADLAKYLDYNEADFGDWAPALTALKEQVSAYLASDAAGRLNTPEMALVDHYVKGSGKDLDGNEAANDYALVSAAVYAANDINAWLEEGGMALQDKIYSVHAGTPVGGASALISTLQSMAENAGARIILNMRATELITEDGKVTGVTAEASDGSIHTYHANGGVVIATGSFSSNGAMCAEYQKIGTGLTAENGSTNPATNVGDGIVMAEALGAQLRDMGFMVTVQEGYHESCSLGEQGKISAQTQVVVNLNGDRFMDDTKTGGMGTAGSVSINQPEGLAYYIGDAEMINALNAAEEGFVDKMMSRGDWFIVADTLEEACEKAGLPLDHVQAAVEAYNTAVTSGTDAEFGRTKFALGAIDEGPFCVIKMEAHYHLTFGGLVINTEAQVLNTANEVISGLYAAGDVISGCEGDTHQSGDCITTMLYYGKAAGEQAAALSK